MGQCVRDFVANHSRQTGICFRDRKNCGVHDDLTTRETKRIHLLVVNDAQFPLKLGNRRANQLSEGFVVGRTDETVGNLTHLCHGRSTLDHTRVAENFLKRL